MSRMSIIWFAVGVQVVAIALCYAAFSDNPVKAGAVVKEFKVNALVYPVVSIDEWLKTIPKSRIGVAGSFESYNFEAAVKTHFPYEKGKDEFNTKLNFQRAIHAAENEGFSIISLDNGVCILAGTVAIADAALLGPKTDPLPTWRKNSSR